MTETLTHTAPELAEIPAGAFLEIDGAGPPEDAAFSAAVSALHRDVPLEGTWWSDDPLAFDLERPEGWHWTLAVPVPASVRLVQRPAQRVARLVHHGAYEDEGPSLAALYAFVADRGLRPAGAHSEIYLTDPTRVAPADLRTELRVPVR